MAKILSVFLFLVMTVHNGVGNNIFNPTNQVLQVVDTSSKWENRGIFSLSLAQAALINWAAGGENSFAVNGLMKYFTNYTSSKTSWENVINVGYGFMKQGNNERYLKTDDKFHVASKYGHRINEFLNYTLLLNFDTQMAIGRNENDQKIANLFAPAYLITSLGFDLRVQGAFSVVIAALTSKFTFVNDQQLANQGSFGLEGAVYDDFGVMITQARRYRSEFGGYVSMNYVKNDFEQEWLNNISINSKLTLFNNYLVKPENLDVNWELLVVMKVNKFLSVNINTHLYYDHDVKTSVDNDNDGTIDSFGPRVQFKELLGIGFVFNY
ncbi:MAG: DUF3078 domain-containing protein [Cytophagales bacterium]|jgi:hypothetical protein|nr:DUF3078 domain-containing protein [Flammeovirgaceae bacterium]|tara:strand:- start:2260 stop:3231 length:972 start_codon:yes stop_codon:yes gene_type:complete